MSQLPIQHRCISPACLEKQNCEGIGVRMFVSDPGTPKAETCIAYSRPGEHNEEDLVVEYEAFNGYFEQRSIPFLDEAKVDFAEDKFGGQLNHSRAQLKTAQCE